jgi:Protein of unknown function (DUF2738)
MSFENTQLTSAFGYNVNNMVFGKPKDGSIPNSAVAFKRIMIGTRNPDGTTGELVIPTTRVYSYGLAPTTNLQTGKQDGYTMSLCLHNRDSPSKEEKEWVETFESVVDHVKAYLLEHRDEIGKYELEASDLKKLSPVFYKRDKGKIVGPPTLYVKVNQNKKTDEITTPFCNERGEDIDPLSTLNKRCWATAAIKVESIFIGAKISLQIKLYEASVKVIDMEQKRLLRPSAFASSSHDDEKQTAVAVTTNPFVLPAKEDDKEEEDDGSVKGSDDESDEQPAAKPATPPQQPVKSTGRRVVRKP